MAISLVTVTTPNVDASGGGNCTVTLPTLQEWDVVVAICGASRTGYTKPTDYVDIYSSLTSTPSLYVGYKVMTSSPDTSVVFTGNGNAQDSSGLLVYVLRGVHHSTVQDQTATTVASTNPASITPATTGALVIDAVAVAVRDTSPGTNDGSNILTAIANDTFDVTVVASTYSGTASVATDPGSWASLTATSPLSVTCAFRPAPEAKNVDVGLVSESDASRLVNRVAWRTGETDAAQAATRRRSYAVGTLPASANLAQPVTVNRGYALGLPEATDLAQQGTSSKAAAVGQLETTELAQPVTAELTSGQSIDVLPAAEADAAQLGSSVKAAAVAQAAETDEPQAAAHAWARTLAQPVESDAPQAAARSKAAASGQALEGDTSQTGSGSKARAVTLPTEQGLSQPAGTAKALTLADVAADAETALDASYVRTVNVAQASSSDAAQPVTWTKQKTIGRPLEVDAALAVSTGEGTAVAPAAEEELVLATTGAKSVHVGIAWKRRRS